MIKKTLRIGESIDFEKVSTAYLVQQASKFKASTYIEYDGVKVNAKSIMGMLTLCLKNDTDILISADGSDEQLVIDCFDDILS